ncbi:MAG: sigma 54-interacting transcriptional regulator, partial [Myxococcales bacterium]|nr:sigma 54-interacting transcriptional regulator [Myxococcales bacterium]
LRGENVYLRRREGKVRFDNIIGEAPAMKIVLAQLERVIDTRATVCIAGETGTGKELIASAVHNQSQRQDKMFVAQNCAALPENLLESELFGHRRGAFTSADSDKKGLFEIADGGTLFLDEMGEMPLTLQAKLLRVLQEGEVLPVGATKPVRVDARVIAATWRDLRALADAGGFRLDLYARMSPWEIRVPALRSRRADLLAWIERIHQHWRRERGLHPDVPRFEANAVERLLLFPWSDNLRGIDRLVHQQSSDAVYDVPPDWAAIPRGPAPALAAPTAAVVIEEGSSDRPKRRSRPSREELVQALAAHDGSVRATAKALGRERRLIYRWMELYGLRSK